MADFKINRAGIRELLHSAEITKTLEVAATRVEAKAKASSRVETPASAVAHRRISGKFRNSIHREIHRNPSRVTVRVVADCRGAAAIEKRDHTLKRAIG